MSRIQQMNVELTAVTEGQRSYITKLETSLQDVTNDKDLGKNSVLHLQQVIGKAEERKQVKMYYAPYIMPSFHACLLLFFFYFVKGFNK